MTLRILHLEDDPVDAELVRLALARGGLSCDIRAVGNGDEFTAELQSDRFDVILSDSGIPGYDGLAAKAAAHERYPDVPFIVVSGHVSSEDSNSVSKSNLRALAPAIEKALKNPPAAQPRGMHYLVEVVQQLSLARNLQSITTIVRQAARKLVDADGATFVLRDADHCFYADEDAISPLWKGQRFPMSACISGWVMLNARHAAIGDIYQDSRIPHEAYRPTFVKSMVMTPIRTKAPVGAIGVYWAGPRQPSSEEIALLAALADSTSVAMESVDLLANLEKRVADRTGELQRRSTELEVLNRELEAFSYSVAHDLRAPLTAIEGFSRELLDSNGGRLDRGGREHLDRISTSVQRMHALINDLLDLSKIARAPMHYGSVDLSHVATEILTGLRETNPGREVEAVVAAQLVHEGDAGLLRIVLENLLSNAWKFTAKTSRARIEFGISNKAAERKIYFVRDNGAGFDPRFASRLFSPFQRLHAQAHFPGTGIGLATVQRIIHRHGGEIWADAAVDRGACFFFTLQDGADALRGGPQTSGNPLDTPRIS